MSYLEDGQIAIIQKTNHSLIDGVSGVDVATLLLDASPEYSEPVVPEWEPEPAPSASQLLLDTLRERLTEPAEMLRSVRSLLRGPRRAVGMIGDGVRSMGTLMTAGLTMHQHFRNLGINPRQMAEYTVKLQDEVTRDMRQGAPDGARRRDAVRGLLNPGKGYGPRILDFIHPHGGIAAAPAWHRTALKAWKRAAAAADRALA